MCASGRVRELTVTATRPEYGATSDISILIFCSRRVIKNGFTVFVAHTLDDRKSPVARLAADFCVLSRREDRHCDLFSSTELLSMLAKLIGQSGSPRPGQRRIRRRAGQGDA